MGRTSLAVDRQRWERAQAWELAFWQRAQSRTRLRRILYAVLRPALVGTRSKRVTGDDWNLWWRNQFGDYEFLPRELGAFIELGCGPYTNTRLILQDRRAGRIICSDPLAEEYLRFQDRWLARAARKGLIEIDAHPIEECPFERDSFDVVVLINVLDHVMDAPVCLETAIQLVGPGGYFIFGQDLSDSAERPEWFDEGHPIKVTIADVTPFLNHFEPVVNKVLSRDESRDPRTQSGVLVFAGRKLSS